VTTDQFVIFAILLALFALLVWGRWRYDVVAFAALMTAVAAGLVAPGEASTASATRPPSPSPACWC
jgi:hypothetical protein